jgi:hypothetical protein
MKKIYEKYFTKENLKSKSLEMNTYLGLFSYWFGYHSNLALTSIIWPAQIELIVSPGQKELLNGIVGIPSTLINTFVPPLCK